MIPYLIFFKLFNEILILSISQNESETEIFISKSTIGDSDSPPTLVSDNEVHRTSIVTVSELSTIESSISQNFTKARTKMRNKIMNTSVTILF